MQSKKSFITADHGYVSDIKNMQALNNLLKSKFPNQLYPPIFQPSTIGFPPSKNSLSVSYQRYPYQSMTSLEHLS